MAEETPTRRVEDLALHRSLLFYIAYRRLSSVADAEDVVQEAYLRWQEASETEVRSPRAYTRRW
jgi:RNA polymerase sigma-70 factor, ECF subfamily